MSGKILGSIIVLSALIAGVALYYLQVYHFYEPIEASGEQDVVITSLASGQPEPVLYDNFEAIDADTSPIRYRACFSTTMSHAMMTETFQAYDERPEPKVAPGWFDCFDANEIGTALKNGTALAFVGTKNIEYGIDRIVAVMADGRGFAWHQINRCGEIAFDGDPLPASCPPKPEGQ